MSNEFVHLDPSPRVADYLCLIVLSAGDKFRHSNAWFILSRSRAGMNRNMHTQRPMIQLHKYECLIFVYRIEYYASLVSESVPQSYRTGSR